MVRLKQGLFSIVVFRDCPLASVYMYHVPSEANDGPVLLLKVPFEFLVQLKLSPESWVQSPKPLSNPS